MITSFDFQAHTRVVFGDGSFKRLGEFARELNFRRTLIVADQGMIACGYVDEAIKLLKKSGVEPFTFHDFDENPDTAMVEAGRSCAASLDIDSIIGLGGGSSMDCAKGINFVLTGGGSMRDYWGHDKLSAKTSKPMLPMIGVPTTAGTGSEAQSYALISDAETHVKMACGDRQAAFKIAILDPRLTLTLPAPITAVAGYDAISHAVETYVTTKRNPISEIYSREAWRLLESNYERVLAEPQNIEARSAMLLGAYLAGVAIENSMLGGAHACANPLTKNFGTPHGEAISVMLPHIVRWNSIVVGDRYRDLSDSLPARLARMAKSGGLPSNLSALKVIKSDLPVLAEEASKQWTGGFNPRPWSMEGALEVYESAL